MIAMGYAAPYEARLPCFCKDNCTSCGVPREGDLKIVANHHLRVNDYTDYIVTHFLGRGVFGQVVQALRVQNSKTFAIKVLKNTPSYYEQGKTELNVLLRLLKNGAERQPVTHLIEAFELNGHLCLVFELYRENLYEYLKKNRFTPFSVANIRYIGFQLLQALDFLLACKVIHTDIKPENIMFVNNPTREFEIRLIDFGSAVVSDRPSLECCYLQSRYYRSPEVLVRSEITAASDMFSVGCVLAELYIGYPLMAGNNEYEQLKLIIEMIGPLPNCLIISGKSGTRFFNFFLGGENNVSAMLKEDNMDRVSSFKEKRKQCHNIRTLSELQYYKRSSHYDENTPMLLSPEYERHYFSDLLHHMLCTDPKRRITPSVAKYHNFFRSGYDAPSFGLTPHSSHSPQMLQMAQQRQQQNAAINQYLPAALTTIYQQLSYAPAIYVQNVQLPQPPAVAATAAAVQYATTVAALAPQVAPQSNQMQFIPTTAGVFPNTASLQNFGHVIQQLMAPGNQYNAAFQLIPGHQPLQAIQPPQQQQILLTQPQAQLVLDPQHFCYQLQGRPSSRSRSPL